MALFSLKKLQYLDWPLLISVLVLFAFGISAIYSVELSRGGESFPFLQKQMIAFVLGTILSFFLLSVHYLQWRGLGRLLYLLGIGLLIAVFFVGQNVRGTTGWFVLGPVSFQPVEFMKIALVIIFARYFGERARRTFGWKEIMGSGFLVAVPVVLTIMQPDLGSGSLLIGSWIIVMFFAGLKWFHALVFGVSGVMASVLGWFFVLKDYQKDRIMVFLDPELDPLGIGYNIVQAKIAIGSGGFFGKGLGFGSQSQLKFLPESQTDFIFSVISEELGFVGVTILLLAFFIFLWRILLIAYRSRDHFTSFLAVGIFGIFFTQIMVNIGVNLAILPATGVALPFVSYGGSSLLISLLLVGILQNIAINESPSDRLNSVL